MNWTVLKKLEEIYKTGETKKSSSLLKDPQVNNLIKCTKELIELRILVVKGKDYDQYYERFHKANFIKYSDFLRNNGLLTPQCKIKECDLNILIDIKNKINDGEIPSVKDGLIFNNENMADISNMFFKDDKYLYKNKSLSEYVKKLLRNN
ncbi:MAG TPA: hypothetical protein QF753_07270 [Victivallales bacterium]|nr:hypothetical protein [Victivallales bacterium]